jgi:hypothetical protein
VWANDAAGAGRLRELFATDATRVQAIPGAWRDAFDDCRLYEYRFAPGPFTPWPDAEGQWVAHEPLGAESVESVGPLVQKHAAAGVDLRFVDDLGPVRARALDSGLPFSIVRYANPGTFPGTGRV